MKNYNEQIFTDRLKNFLFSATDYIQNEQSIFEVGHHDNEKYEITAADFCQDLSELISDMFCATVMAEENGLSVNFSNGKNFRISIQQIGAE